jgi:hypothetical protein
MPRVVAKQVEVELTLDQMMALVRQLKPEEQAIIRRAIQPPPWQQRLEALLTRVWSRVERFPISEEEIDAEVERARTAIYTHNSYLGQWLTRICSSAAYSKVLFSFDKNK